MTPIVLGIDPGARHTGLVVRRGDALLHHTTIEGPVAVQVVGVPMILRSMWDRYKAEVPLIFAVEGLNEPSPHMGLTNLKGLLGTAQVLGAILGHWPHAVVVPPGRHGSAPLAAYPEALRPTRGTGAGRDSLRHERSAWDCAGAAATLRRMGAA